MAKFLPFFGEIYTIAESTVLIGAAGLAKACGDDKAASKLASDAGKSWKEYTETSIIATPINGLVQDIKGNEKESKRLKGTLLESASSCVDGIPVAGHIKGVVHYACGDKKGGNKSMEASTKVAAVLGAGILTGGLGGGLVGGALAGVGTGVVYDGAATVIDEEVNGNEAKLHGSIALAEIEKMTTHEFVGTVFGIVGDGMTGAGGAQIGKNIKASKTGQKKLQQTYKKSNSLKDTDVNHKNATKITMETAKENRKAQGVLKKSENYATSKAIDKVSGEQGVGNSGHYRKQMRIENRPEGQSKKAAARANNYDKPSHLQKKYPDVKQSLEKRPQAACAEHPAFDNLAEKNPNYAANDVVTSTVYQRDGKFSTKVRCDNCKAYGSNMGNVITDCIPDGTSVPSCDYISNGSLGSATATVVVASTMETYKKKQR